MIREIAIGYSELRLPYFSHRSREDELTVATSRRWFALRPLETQCEFTLNGSRHHKMRSREAGEEIVARDLVHEVLGNKIASAQSGFTADLSLQIGN
jgi:hypothetical protein